MQYTGQNATLRIPTPLKDGFFVRVTTVLAQSSWAEKRGIPWFVEGNATTDPYFDAARFDDNWLEYFAAPTDVRPSKDREAGVIQLSCGSAFRIYHYEMNRRHSIYPSTMQQAVLARAAHSEQLKRWFRIQPEIVTAAQMMWNTTLERTIALSLPPAVLGVHMRGTDKFIGRRVLPDEYWPLIDAWRSQCRGVIFLATDDPTYAAAAKTRYGDVLLEQDTVLRSQTNIFLDSAHGTPHAKGLQVLVDMLVLSKTHFLLKSNSAVAEFAVYLHQHTEGAHEWSYDFTIQDQPQPIFSDLDCGT